MNTIINKSLDTLIKQAKKIPYALIVLFLFSSLFSAEATKIRNIVISKVKILLPKSSIQVIRKILFSQDELVNVWLFFIMLLVITIVLDITIQLSEEKSCLVLGPGVGFLLEFNSIIFLLILIDNKTSQSKINIQTFHPTTLYGFFSFIAFLIFFSLFLITYFGFIMLIFKHIVSSKIKLILKILYLSIWTLIIYWLSLSFFSH